MTHVSIVMCVGNRPKHLRNTLQGWSNVEYPDLDFTIIDNFSQNPETKYVVDEFSGILPISYYWVDSWHNMNRLWNRYGKGSDGEYVIFAMMDEIVCGKDVIYKMLEVNEHRSSIFTYFMSEQETSEIGSIPWQKDPCAIPKPFTRETSAGLISHITGAYREYWDWFGWFRDDQNGHLWLDQDLHLREVCLGNTCKTPDDVYCLHQYHPLAIYPQGYTQPGYSYHNELQARLLEPAIRDRA